MKNNVCFIFILLLIGAVVSCNKLSEGEDYSEEFIVGNVDMVRNISDGLYKNGELVLPIKDDAYHKTIFVPVTNEKGSVGFDTKIVFGPAFAITWNPACGMSICTFDPEQYLWECAFDPEQYTYDPNLPRYEDDDPRLNSVFIHNPGLRFDELENYPGILSLDYIYIMRMTGSDLSTATRKSPEIKEIKINAFKFLGPVDIRVELNNGNVYDLVFKGGYQIAPGSTHLKEGEYE